MPGEWRCSSYHSFLLLTPLSKNGTSDVRTCAIWFISDGLSRWLCSIALDPNHQLAAARLCQVLERSAQCQQARVLHDQLVQQQEHGLQNNFARLSSDDVDHSGPRTQAASLNWGGHFPHMLCTLQDCNACMNPNKIGAVRQRREQLLRLTNTRLLIREGDALAARAEADQLVSEDVAGRHLEARVLQISATAVASGFFLQQALQLHQQLMATPTLPAEAVPGLTLLGCVLRQVCQD